MIPVIDVVGDLLDGRPAASMSTGSRGSGCRSALVAN